MEVKAEAKYIRISPRKARRVANLIKGKATGEAFAILKYLPLKAAEIIDKVLKSAVANAGNNHELNTEVLEVSKVLVNGGPIMKRFRARARGRVNQIKKRTSHIAVFVKEMNS